MLLLDSFIFISGACCGSFITCMAERLSDTHSLYTTQRSICPKCRHQLRFWQLIPVLGVLLQRGRCFDCRSRINLRSTWIELIFGCLVLLNWQAPLTTSAPLLLGYAVLLFNSLTDHDHFSVFPITLVAPAIIGVWIHPLIWSVPLFILIGLLISLYLIAWQTKKFGAGDVDILVLLTCLATPNLVFNSLILASAAALTIFIIQPQRRQLPFVPFLTWAFILTTQLV
ncbi:prepilin peptidase [Lactiplantibacillus pingfangensis]|uniref:prepilin peptidase n=1 Tax=Lactiplantibacillus pingfangensis TaxID=2559915 RepID=UPI0010F89ABF|nr:A24 family peptidase [Lactiplantibacillus pingfangensis]